MIFSLVTDYQRSDNRRTSFPLNNNNNKWMIFSLVMRDADYQRSDNRSCIYSGSGPVPYACTAAGLAASSQES